MNALARRLGPPWGAAARVLVAMAFRNLFAHRLKTVIVGAIIGLGAALVVVGTSLLDSIDHAMSRSITGSVAGHIQLTSSKSKDELALWGDMAMSDPDLEPIDDFAELRTAVAGVPNVKTIIPMGIGGALITSGNTIDIALERLRDTVRQRLDGATGAEIDAEYEARKAHVRQMASVLEKDLANLSQIAEEGAVEPEAIEAVHRASSEAFWQGFDADPLASLEFLENQVAPQLPDADLLWLGYVGTDLDTFAQSFDRMEIVDGTAVPSGERGLLIAKFGYEEYCKLKTARRLDKIHEGITERGKTIAEDEELSRFVRENVAQVREIALQLDPIATRKATEKLERLLGPAREDANSARENANKDARNERVQAEERAAEAETPNGGTELTKLLERFFDMDDASFAARYKFFYDEIAPMVELYRVRIGEPLTIKMYTRSGYARSVNVKVWGTFRFQGLEKSALAGALNLMDLVSFRQLYGHMTKERAEEVSKLQAEAGVKGIARERAEEELFGGGPLVTGTEAAPVPDVGDLFARAGDAGQMADRFARDEMERGVILNAAVILDDPSRLDESVRALEAATKAAGLEVKAVPWQAAAGIIGKFVVLLRAVLYTAVLIIFAVALIVLNNALVMAALERVQEIGTLRAIGAQRRLVLAMMLIEAAVLGIVFGGLGAGLGAAVVQGLHAAGIPATDDAFYFFFSGPRLRPTLGASNLVIAFAIVIVTSALSALYPALLAMRITPRQAMATEE